MQPDDPVTRLTRLQRLSLWVVNHLPRIVVTDTLQVALAFAWVCVGAGSLMTLSEPSVIQRALYWTALRVEWSVTFIVGGTAQIWGLQRESRMWERCGLALSAIGTTTYALALVANGKPAGYVVAGAFVMFSAAYLIRLMASTAARTRRFP